MMLIQVYVMIPFLINTNVIAGFASVSTMAKSPNSNARAPAMQNSIMGMSFPNDPQQVNKVMMVVGTDSIFRTLSVHNNSTTAPFLVVVEAMYGTQKFAERTIGVPDEAEILFVSDFGILDPTKPSVSLYKKIKRNSMKDVIEEGLLLGTQDKCIVINGDYEKPKVVEYVCEPLKKEVTSGTPRRPV